MNFLKLLKGCVPFMFLFLTFPCWVEAGEALNAIEAISADQQNGSVVLKVDFKEALSTVPASFSIANPARVAFDFPATTNSLGKNSQSFSEGDLKSVNVVQVGDRTRLVLNLIRSVNYDSKIEGRSIYVKLFPVAGMASPVDGTKSVRFSDERGQSDRHIVNDVMFRRGKDGEGRIVVDLSDSSVGIDIKQQGTNLVVDFLKTGLPERLRRKLDVNDFATPVSSFVMASQGEHVRMTISPKGKWEHNAYQSENQFVVEIKQALEDPNKLAQGSRIGYQGPRVSINYQNGDVRALLRLMAEELGLNAVISDTVTGTITLVLKDIPADQVIDIIFRQKGLDMRKSGSVIMIAPRDEITTREKLEFESRQQINDLEPLVLETVQLNYQKAVNVARLLLGQSVTATSTTLAGASGVSASASGAGSGSGVQRILSKRGTVTADPVTNNIFINDIPSKLEEIRKFIKVIDVGSRQVMIEARVVEANDSFNKDLGAKMNFLSSALQSTRIGNSGISIAGGAATSPTSTSSFSTASGTTTSSSTFTPGSQTTSQTAGVNLPSYSAKGGALAFSLFNSSLSRILNLELYALETDGRGKVISSPRVVTANNVTATIEDGTEVPYVTPSTTGSPATVTFKSAKLSLKATPQITPEGRVLMKLEIAKEEPDWTKAVQGNPPIKSTKVDTEVVVDNGGTVVIGGVFSVSNTNTTERVPFLGDLPYVGFLFKVNSTENTRRELLVFITPRVLNEQLEMR